MFLLRPSLHWLLIQPKYIIKTQISVTLSVFNSITKLVNHVPLTCAARGALSFLRWTPTSDSSWCWFCSEIRTPNSLKHRFWFAVSFSIFLKLDRRTKEAKIEWDYYKINLDSNSKFCCFYWVVVSSSATSPWTRKFFVSKDSKKILISEINSMQNLLRNGLWNY